MTREEAIHHLYTYSSTNGSGQTTDEQHNEAKRMAIKALEKEPVLDKIRAEIETKYGQCKLTEYIVQYDGICTSANDIGDIADILQIIDKYKVGSEDKK